MLLPEEAGPKQTLCVKNGTIAIWI